jgi:hypothetical protein
MLAADGLKMEGRWCINEGSNKVKRIRTADGSTSYKLRYDLRLFLRHENYIHRQSKMDMMVPEVLGSYTNLHNDSL